MAKARKKTFKSFNAKVLLFGEHIINKDARGNYQVSNMNAGLLFVISIIVFVVGILLFGIGYTTPISTPYISDILFYVGIVLYPLGIIGFIVSIIWGIVNFIRKAATDKRG